MARAGMSARLDRLEQRLRPMLRASASVPPEEESRRTNARQSLLPFIEYTFPDYHASWHHYLLCQRLERWADTPGDRLIVSMPPQHGKSQIISRHFPAWLLGRDPDAPVMLCSYGASLANRLNRQSQRIVASPAYAELFPGTRLPKKGKDEGTRSADLWEVARRGGSLRSAGVGGGIAGMPFRYGIIDDPCKGRAKAESPVERERIWDWYTGDFYTRRSPDARMLVVATRWHEDDLPGRLLSMAESDPEADRYDTLILPAVAEVGMELANGDPRQPGEALWPERYPLSDLAKVRAQSEADWYSLYQQDPRRGANAEWPPEHFGEHIWFDEWPPLACKAVSLDPSKGRTDRPGDYAAIIAGGYDGNDGTWAEATMGRWPVEQLVKRTIDVCVQFQPDVFALESNCWQELLSAPLLAEARARDYLLPIVQVENYVPKNVRIRRLGPHLGLRNLHVRGTADGRLLVQQLRQFPLADHDDGPDALEVCQRTLIGLWNGKRGKG